MRSFPTVTDRGFTAAGLALVLAIIALLGITFVLYVNHAYVKSTTDQLTNVGRAQGNLTTKVDTLDARHARDRDSLRHVVQRLQRRTIDTQRLAKKALANDRRLARRLAKVERTTEVATQTARCATETIPILVQNSNGELVPR